MTSDGKQLESLVAFVEKQLLPQGFQVKHRERVYNDEGIQIAEFDIVIEGMLGSGNIKWLIECRDRPGQGAAPGSWIEQLVGRKSCSCFNKVTAVSTTGFSPGAVEYASKGGIELREVKAVSAEEFAWLLFSHFDVCQRKCELLKADIRVEGNHDEATIAAGRDVLLKNTLKSKVLRAAMTGELVSPLEAWQRVAFQTERLWHDVMPNSPGRSFSCPFLYKDEDDYFLLVTVHGALKVREIVFDVRLSLLTQTIPLTSTIEYCSMETGTTISQTASFGPVELCNQTVSFEMYHFAETGQIQIALRKHDKDIEVNGASSKDDK